MIDAAGTVATYLRADPTLMGAVANAIYCETVPDTVTYPFVVVRTIDVEVATQPVVTWGTYGIQVDAVGEPDDAPAVTAVAGQIRDLLAVLRGEQGDATVASTTVELTRFLLDDTVSPARPRWVVAASLVARSTTE